MEWQKMNIQLRDLAYSNEANYTNYIISVALDNKHKQSMTIKKIDGEILIEIPDDSGGVRHITVNAKDESVTSVNGAGRITKL